MKQKFLLAVAILSVPLFSVSQSHSQCVEVSISTCVGDFADGGEYEDHNRLLGNASAHSLGFIEDNTPRIFIASGSLTVPGSTRTATPGFVGIYLDGITQQPQHHLDVWGRVRSTDTALFATATGSVGIGVSSPSSKLDISGGSITVRGLNAGMRIEGGIMASSVTIGTSTILAVLHVEKSHGYGITSANLNVGTVVIAQNDGTGGSSAFYQIISGESGYAGISMGDAADPTKGEVSYDNLTDKLVFTANGAETAQMTATNFTVKNASISSSGSNSGFDLNGISLGVWMATTSANNLLISNTNYMELSGSTQTKTGSIYIASMTATKDITSISGYFVGDGSKLTNLPASGGGASNSTFTFSLKSGGDVFPASSTFIAIPGAFLNVGKSTWNVIDMRAFTIYTSTTADTVLQIKKSTSTDVGSPALDLGPLVHVSTNSKYSVWTSTSFQIQANETISLWNLWKSTESAVGTPAAEYGITMRAWKQPEPYP